MKADLEDLVVLDEVTITARRPWLTLPVFLALLALSLFALRR